MIMDMLLIFVIAVILLFILSLLIIDDRPWLSLGFISLGMIFSVLCAYEFWNFEWFYIGYNSTIGNTTPYIYNTYDYGQPYSYVFMVIFFMFCMLMVKAGANVVQEALQTQGELDYNLKYRNRRR